MRINLEKKKDPLDKIIFTINKTSLMMSGSKSFNILSFIRKDSFNGLKVSGEAIYTNDSQKINYTEELGSFDIMVKGSNLSIENGKDCKKICKAIEQELQSVHSADTIEIKYKGKIINK